MFANFACPKKVEAKTMKRKAAIITILSIMLIGGILIIFIPTQSRHHLEAICRVEGNVCYAVLLNNDHDTLFISLKMTQYKLQAYTTIFPTMFIINQEPLFQTKDM